MQARAGVRAVIVAAPWLIFAPLCHAGGEWPDSPNKWWFENLQRPDNHLNPYRKTDPKSLTCCGVADTVKTKFKVEPGDAAHPDDRWYALLSSDCPGSGPYCVGEATAWPNCSVVRSYCRPDDAAAAELVEWVLIPPEKIVPDYAPDGRAYLFMLAGTIQCFVRPRGDF